MEGKVTRYAVDMVNKGYLFFRDYPSDYAGTYTIRQFTYRTDPFNPDTDLDGQNDSADPVPLDYDMDGDGYPDEEDVFPNDPTKWELEEEKEPGKKKEEG